MLTPREAPTWTQPRTNDVYDKEPHKPGPACDACDIVHYAMGLVM